MSIYTIYFSPTGNTKKCVNQMAEAINLHIMQTQNGRMSEDENITEYDCTTWDSLRKALDCDSNIKDADALERCLGETDFVIIGAPVYGGRIPKIARDRLEKFKGCHTPCILVASYGNRHYDDALLEMKDLAEDNGFVVKGAAAVIGRHTYGDIQVDRPNQKDLEQMSAFAVNAFESREAISCIPGDFPYKEGGNGGRFKPSTLNSCVQCGLCRRGCPADAIAEDFTVIADRCISCFRCIRNCPVKAKVMDTEEYLQFAADFTHRLSQRRENEFYLYKN